jgi:hypothetical protein
MYDKSGNLCGSFETRRETARKTLENGGRDTVVTLHNGPTKETVAHISSQGYVYLFSAFTDAKDDTGAKDTFKCIAISPSEFETLLHHPAMAKHFPRQDAPILPAVLPLRSSEI